MGVSWLSLFLDSTALVTLSCVFVVRIKNVSYRFAALGLASDPSRHLQLR